MLDMPVSIINTSILCVESKTDYKNHPTFFLHHPQILPTLQYVNNNQTSKINNRLYGFAHVPNKYQVNGVEM